MQIPNLPEVAHLFANAQCYLLKASTIFNFCLTILVRPLQAQQGTVGLMSGEGLGEL